MSRMIPRILTMDLWNSPRSWIYPRLKAFEDDLNRLALRSAYEPSFFDNWFRLDPFEDSNIKINKDTFEASIECKNFEPEDIKVKIENGFVVVEGKFEKKSDHGHWSQSFVQKLSIPDNVIQESFVCNLDRNGILKLTAKKKPESIEDSKAREIPVQINTK